ncbi:MAG: FMN-binding protein [Vicinamibacterales bacterium]
MHLAAAVTAGIVLAATAVVGAGPLSREEALRLAFPGATVTAERVFLTEQQQQAAAAAAGVPVPTALVARYVATRDGVVVGRAYVDTHTVRTKAESLLVSLDASGVVRRVDVTAFLEPDEYAAPGAFLDQFGGRALSDDLHLQRALRPISGATLTSRAVTDAVRRVLAIDGIIGRRGPP